MDRQQHINYLCPGPDANNGLPVVIAHESAQLGNHLLPSLLPAHQSGLALAMQAWQTFWWGPWVLGSLAPTSSARLCSQ
jgi:hypothetical protein